MGSKMREKMDTVRTQIELRRGMVKQFLKHYKCNDPSSIEYKSMTTIMDCLLNLIKNQLPFSDDLLLLCYHFELSQMKNKLPTGWRAAQTKTGATFYIDDTARRTTWTHPVSDINLAKGGIGGNNIKTNNNKNTKMKKQEEDNADQKVNPLETRVWQTIKAVCDKVLKLPLNRHQWLWFKSYLLPSALFYEEIPNSKDDKSDENGKGKGVMLYMKLVEIVRNQLKAQAGYLKKPIGELEKELNATSINMVSQNSWYQLKKYGEYTKCDFVRQDSCKDSKSGQELMPYPNKPTFDEKSLKQLTNNMNSSKNKNVEKFNFASHYDINGYLNKLKIVAHQLNEKFHYTMFKIMGIDNYFKNEKLNLVYHAGPVKKLARCVAKAQTGEVVMCCFVVLLFCVCV